jgi:large subunit ribosomal protein L13
MRTYSTKASDIERKWWVIDASGKTLGRLASEVAGLLKGKHKPIYAPHLDVGDNVIVVNAAKVRVTGDKLTKKIYYRHSQYPGGLKSTSLAKMMETHPTRVIEHAVKGMLPHNRLGAAMFRKLRVYPGPEHPHEAQVGAMEKES